MSRWSSTTAATVAAVTCVAALAVGFASVVSVAEADPRRQDAPIRTVTAPVLDLVVSTSDLGGGTRTDERRRRVDVTLQAEAYFGKDSARLRGSARAELDRVAADLRRRGPGRVLIVGYTDDLGSKAHGLVLSRQRAAAVAGVLRGRLPAAAYPIAVRGRGEADPAVPNTSEKNRRLNRRVVITYTPTRSRAPARR